MRSRALAGSLLALLALTPACAPTRSDALLDAAQKARELDAAGRYAEAEPLLREALKRSRWGLGTKDPVTGRTQFVQLSNKGWATVARLAANKSLSD